MNLRPGDYVLLVRLGEEPRLVRAEGDIDGLQIGTTFLRGDGAHVWEYPLQRALCATPHGRCFVVWPAGMPGPCREFVAEAVAALSKRPAVH